MARAGYSPKVLVAGGYGTSSVLTSAEVYDPGVNTWTPVASLHTARIYHTATLLPNGQVLVAGGYNGSTLTVEYGSEGNYGNSVSAAIVQKVKYVVFLSVILR